jgi:hypothetical protein
MPTPQPVPGFSAAEVGEALGQVRAALVAGRLDRRMLVDHDPNRLLPLLAPNQREHIRAWFADDGAENIATRVAPAAG